MSSIIPPATFPVNSPLCAVSDVNALLFQVVNTFSVDDTLMQNAIDSAQDTLSSRCNRPLTPTRIVMPVDGNGHTRMVLPYHPILAVNSVSIYYNYPLSLTRVAHAYDLIVDRKRGIISFPPLQSAALLVPYSYMFYQASQNIMLDYTVGWSKQIYGETLSTTDHLTYSFANPTVVPQSMTTLPNGNTPPVYGPLIYIDGVPQINTTYVNTQNLQNTWQIQSDNLVYTLNIAPGGGIMSITFPSTQAAHTITADYSYQYIPNDLQDACSKLACITILNAIALAPYGDVTTGGMTQIQVNGFRTQANDRGQFGAQIQSWEDEIQRTVQLYRRSLLPIGHTYRDNSQVSSW